MSDEINQIRDLLEIIEKNQADDVSSFRDDFQLFELPDVLTSIVDYLQPLLLPYESAIYWYLFRHSILKTGDTFVRVSTRGLGKPKTVIKSASGQSEGLSSGGVQDALKGLEDKSVIQKAGDTNREGTLYKLFLPEEIQMCQDRMKDVLVEALPVVDPLKEADYYNIKENRLKVFERDSFKCSYCHKQLTRFSATLDHIHPVSEGGDNSFDNLITSCIHCNSKKGGRPIMDFILSPEK